MFLEIFAASGVSHLHRCDSQCGTCRFFGNGRLRHTQNQGAVLCSHETCNMMISGRGHSPIKKKTFIFISEKNGFDFPRCKKKNTSRALVFRGLRRQNFTFAKNGENKSTTMAKIVFAFPPRLGNYAEICLEGASAGGLPTRPRERMFVYSPYIEVVQKRNHHFNPMTQ